MSANERITVSRRSDAIPRPAGRRRWASVAGRVAVPPAYRRWVAVPGLALLLLLALASHPPAAALAPGGWTPAAAMRAPRHGHAATLLMNGGVLVAGGAPCWPINSACPASASAEVYDLWANVWLPAAAMGTARFFPVAVPLSTGKVLVAGGRACVPHPGDPCAALASAELYDPATNTWTAAGNMSRPRAGHTATRLADGRVLVAGGGPPGDATAELFDPGTGTWSPAAGMSVGRFDHTAALLANGKVLVAGGGGACASATSVVPALASAELYDPATDTWSAAPPMAGARGTHTATPLPDGRVLVAGGKSAHTSSGLCNIASTPGAEVYDPQANAWTVAPNMSTPRADHTVTRLPDGSVLVAGGWTIVGVGRVDQNSAERFLPAANAWAPAAGMATPRSDHAAVALVDGGVLVTGGLPGPVAAAERYTPDIGGRGLTLTLAPVGVRLGWTGGSAQSEYAVVRHALPSGTTAILPAGGRLPGTATGFADSPPAGDPWRCYAVLALFGVQVMGVSDVLCAVAGLRTATGMPQDFAIRLNQSNLARLTWSPPVGAGQTGYRLESVPLDGGPVRQVALPAAATSATDDTGGSPTCYALVATAGGSDIGKTDALCAFPGLSTLGDGAGAAVRSRNRAARLTLAEATARVRQAAERLRRALPDGRLPRTPRR
jgi:hypothetical protein